MSVIESLLEFFSGADYLKRAQYTKTSGYVDTAGTLTLPTVANETGELRPYRAYAVFTGLNNMCVPLYGIVFDFSPGLDDIFDVLVGSVSIGAVLQTDQLNVATTDSPSVRQDFDVYLIIYEKSNA